MLPDDTLLENICLLSTGRHEAAPRPLMSLQSGTPLLLSVEDCAHLLYPCRLVVWTCKSFANLGHLLNVLASWGASPLMAIVRFKGHPKTKLLPKNIAIALCHPDRVRGIYLGRLTNTMVASIIGATKKPFQTLKCIRITIKDATGPSLLFRNVFLGGSAPRLREIPLDGINFFLPKNNASHSIYQQVATTPSSYIF